MPFPLAVKIVEVSPRDGLQNESVFIPTEKKIELINRLSMTGLKVIETTSFVSPKWIPQLADNRDVWKGIHQQPGVAYPVLIPNLRGLDLAIELGVKEIAVFTTPSEMFAEKNMNCSVAMSIERIKEVTEKARAHQLRIRGYLSCVLGCPFEGDIPAKDVASLAKVLYELGCQEISLGDTIGVGTVPNTKRLIESVTKWVPVNQLAVHFHDTYGQALVNIYAALEMGVAIVDSAVAGVGGCPYAKGATGNVATEKVLFMLQGLGIETGVNIEKIIEVGRFISSLIGVGTSSLRQ